MLQSYVMNAIPSSRLYKSKTDNTFVLARMTYDRARGWNKGFGPLLRLSAEEFAQNCKDFIVSDLMEFSSRESGNLHSEYQEMTPRMRQTFEDSHLSVFVSLQPGNVIWIDPMHPGPKGGRIGGDPSEERQKILVGATCGEFHAALMKAFDRAE